MDARLLITFGMVAVFFAAVISILYVARIKDASFTDYAVAGRSFNGFYVAMSFLNTWWPGTTFIAFAGLSAASGVIGFYALLYGLLTVMLMYLMARRVWIWGARFNLRTQSDLLALRFNSKHIRTIATVISVISLFPWIVLGMQALGLVFRYLSFNHLSVIAAMLLGVALIGIRQIWTIQMGMRGVVLTDMFQGIIAYVVGSIVIVGLLLFYFHGLSSLNALPPAMFTLPGVGSATGPLYVFALIFTGTLGGWCWPPIFVRLYTSNGVRSLKQSAAIGLPLSFIFFTLLTLLALSGASLPAVARAPQEVWFIVNQEAGGVWLLGLAGIIVFAATMGNVDGNFQAAGAQIANDIVGNYAKLSDKALISTTKLSMALLSVASVITAVVTFNAPNLVTLAIMSYQGIIQLAVPQFLGIFWKQGNKYGAIGGLVVGFTAAVVLEKVFPTDIPAFGGLTSGVIALAINAAIYVTAAFVVPQPKAETDRVDDLFRSIGAARIAREPLGVHEGEPAPQPS
jgi:SSS family solute:Na+ symporter